MASTRAEHPDETTPDPVDGAPEDHHTPTGVDRRTGFVATAKRLVSETGEDNLTDWAASLTYYFVLAVFPALIALISIVGLVLDPRQVTDALTTLLENLAPGSAETFGGVVDDLAGSTASAGIGLVIGLATALFAASGYVGAFTRAANVIWETPEGRPFYRLKPMQLLITLIGILFVVLIALSVVATGPVTDAIGEALGLGSTATTVWDIAKWPVIVVVVAVMIAVLYRMTPNVRPRRFRLVSPGAAFALVAWMVASGLFGFYVANFGSYNKTYGALAGIVVFLVWLWITNLVLLIGLQLDAERERDREMADGVPRADVEIQLEPRADPKPPKTA